MESNEQTEITRKIETHPHIESKVTAKGEGRVGGRRIEKKEKGLRDMDNSVVIAEEEGI